jgi:hypothetical protein
MSFSPLFCEWASGGPLATIKISATQRRRSRGQTNAAVYCAYHMLPLGLVLLLHDENKFGFVRHKQWKEVIGFIKFILSLNYAIAPGDE